MAIIRGNRIVGNKAGGIRTSNPFTVIEDNFVAGNHGPGIADESGFAIQNLMIIIQRNISNADERSVLVEALKDFRDSDDKPSRLAAYSRFVEHAANHASLLSPFLPMLAALVG